MYNAYGSTCVTRLFFVGKFMKRLADQGSIFSFLLLSFSSVKKGLYLLLKPPDKSCPIGC